MRIGPRGITFVGTARQFRTMLQMLVAAGPDVTLSQFCSRAR